MNELPPIPPKQCAIYLCSIKTGPAGWTKTSEAAVNWAMGVKEEDCPRITKLLSMPEFETKNEHRDALDDINAELEKLDDNYQFPIRFDFITLTRELINDCRNPNGAFTNATLAHLGMTRSTMTSGWRNRLIGSKITRKQYDLALDGRSILGTKLPKI